MTNAEYILVAHRGGPFGRGANRQIRVWFLKILAAKPALGRGPVLEAKVLPAHGGFTHPLARTPYRAIGRYSDSKLLISRQFQEKAARSGV
jgi:hypothetical protein